MFGSLAPARRRLVLVVLTGLLVLACVAVLLAVRSGGRAAVGRRAEQGLPGPVLLVPGYGGSTAGLQPLASRLRATGRDVTVVSLPDNAQGDLTAQARVLGAAAAAVLARTGGESVDVVGYSAGGVVARIWLKQLGGAAVTRRLVTLGSPQHGTALAELGSLFQGECPLACQQLVPGSTVLDALNAAPELPPGPVVVSLWSSKDQVVLPPDSATLAGAVNVQLQQVCPDSVVDHTQLPADPLVAGLVQASLAAAVPTGFGPGDCARLGG
ncbi:MAG TPA: hypothetical protein VHO01_11285 [Jatrophihabitans sp.]|nr:hypothetical protein [Jatrophihabitans sp.]